MFIAVSSAYDRGIPFVPLPLLLILTHEPAKDGTLVLEPVPSATVIVPGLEPEFRLHKRPGDELHFLGYLSAGASWGRKPAHPPDYTCSEAPGDPYMEMGPARTGLGLGMRVGLSEQIALQARGSLSFVSVGESLSGYCHSRANATSTSVAASAIQPAFDATLRIRTPDEDASLYFGLGPSFGMNIVSGTVGSYDLSLGAVGYGGTFEAGYLVGRREDFDLGLRVELLFIDGNLNTDLVLSIGYAFF